MDSVSGTKRQGLRHLENSVFAVRFMFNPRVVRISFHFKIDTGFVAVLKVFKFECRSLRSSKSL